MAMDGHDRMPVSHIYKAKKQTSTLRASTVVPHGKLALPRQARPFEAKQAVLHRSLHLSEPIHLLRSGHDSFLCVSFCSFSGKRNVEGQHLESRRMVAS